MKISICQFHLTHNGKKALLSKENFLNRSERLVLNYVGMYHETTLPEKRKEIELLFKRQCLKANLPQLLNDEFLKLTRESVRQDQAFFSSILSDLNVTDTSTELSSVTPKIIAIEETNTEQQNQSIQKNASADNKLDNLKVDILRAIKKYEAKSNQFRRSVPLADIYAMPELTKLKLAMT